MNTPRREIIRLPGEAALAQEAVRRIAATAQSAIADHGCFAWALSGGNSPLATYRLLAQSPWRERLDWRHTHIFFADERGVPPDHSDSNYRLVRENLLQRVPIPPANVHPIAADGSPVAAAARYQQAIEAFFAPNPPRFDLVTLGMGPDGHTASLFPGMDDYPGLWVAAVHDAPKPPPLRFTMTYALLNQARNALVLVSGADKAGALAEIAAGSSALPAGKIAIAEQPVVWLVSPD